MPSSPLFFLLLVIFTFVEGDDKLRQLQKLAQKSPIIHFTSADTYNNLVTESARNYSFFILFTATHSKYNCGPCVQIAEEMKQFGVSYEAFFGGDYTSESFLAKPFFLGQVEPNNAMEVFQAYQFTTVPHFVYIPAGEKKVTKLREDHFLRNQHTTTADIINFVDDKTGVYVPQYVSVMDRFLPLVLGAAAVVLLVRLARKHSQRLYDPMLWYTLALMTYMIVMAGVVYNRIRNPPIMDMRDGRAVLIAPSPRTQYVAEGILIAIILSGAGLLFVALGDLVPRVKGPLARRAVFWASSVLLFLFLSALNNIYHVKYHTSAFRLNWRLF